MACLLAVLPSNAAAQLRFQVLGRDTIETRIRGFSGSDAEREARLKKFFTDSGCKDISEEVVKSKNPPNLICVLPGQTDRVILVGAHFDHVTAGDGVVDNWSGASLLPSLLWSVRQAPRQHTYVFVGFTEEEKGLVGSTFYARHLTPQERSKMEAMVNMDTLGLGPTEIWVSHADQTLVRDLEAVAQALNLPVRGMNVDQVGESDSESFARYRIPRITIHSVTQDTWPILHSSRDRLDAIKADEYYDTYKLVAGYLVFLDQSAGQVSPPPPSSAPATKTEH
jgi:Zn-dependent M28 family amino/carboxypeptidase